MNSQFPVLPDANSGRLRWWACLFVAVLGLTFQPSLQAQNAASFTYITNQNGITITGGCPGSPRALVIPETINGLPVTRIGRLAFLGCSSLTTITIPNSVTSIGEGAFGDCTSLANVVIPNSVTHIGEGAFHDGTSLTSITIGKSVTSIRGYTFSDCTRLTRIHFEGNAPIFRWDALEWRNMVTNYYLPGTAGWGPVLADRPTARGCCLSR